MDYEDLKRRVKEMEKKVELEERVRTLEKKIRDLERDVPHHIVDINKRFIPYKPYFPPKWKRDEVTC